MPKPDESRQRFSISEITSDGFIELDDLPPIDFIGHEWDFKFGEADWDKFLVLMVKSSSISPNAECIDANWGDCESTDQFYENFEFVFQILPMCLMCHVCAHKAHGEFT